MNKKITSIVVGLIIIAGVVGYTYKKAPSSQNTYTPSSTPGTSTTTADKTITSAEIATHKDASSCWTTINGGVYDLTAWVPKHPGGERAILSICGVDGSQKFNNKHGGSPLQAKILAGYKIGTLQ